MDCFKNNSPKYVCECKHCSLQSGYREKLYNFPSLLHFFLRHIFLKVYFLQCNIFNDDKLLWSQVYSLSIWYEARHHAIVIIIVIVILLVIIIAVLVVVMEIVIVAIVISVIVV